MAKLYEEKGELKNAENYYGKALKILEKNKGKDCKESVKALNGFGKIYFLQ